ncbi:MAG: hypothetical protein EA425_17645 [Puniceicoccaceae bacterium]|nr:MAG: hypothetical protein EA425_17645 [Puniceicoccaceae bacterium]
MVSPLPRFLSWLMLLLVAPGLAVGASTMDETVRYAWGSSIGWVDWRPSGEDGAVIGEFVCSGYLYAANVGWIHLGGGSPANGIYYGNETGGDFGVNRLDDGALRGLAWGANIGWVVFEEIGDPRIELEGGRLTGRVWAANVGWISMEDLEVITRRIEPGLDSENDGIPDAWKLLHGGSLAALPAGIDSSGNGLSNLESYLAGLDPFDPDAALRITGFSRQEEGLGGALPTTRLDVEFTVVPSRLYRLWTSSVPDAFDEWTASGIHGPGSGPTREVSIERAGHHERLFVRVEALRPLMPPMVEAD